MKKLISFLGTGYYNKCIYTYEDKIDSSETHFIQLAIYETLKKKMKKLMHFIYS